MPTDFATAERVPPFSESFLGPALAAFLAPLGIELAHLETGPVKNSRGEIVGELRVTTS